MPLAPDTVHEVLELYYGDDIPEDLAFDLRDLDNLVVQMGVGQNGSIRHSAVQCDTPTLPFLQEEAVGMFADLIQTYVTEGFIPQGFHLLPNEVGVHGYPATQSIQVGQRGGKRDVQKLPVDVWYPRAVAWARGLHALEQTVSHFDVAE